MSRKAPLDPKRICVAAWRLPDLRQQDFVDRVCGENASLRAEVEALRAAKVELEQEGTFLRTLRDVISPPAGQATTRSRPLPFGTRIAGRYVTENLIGEGSSGRVYVARDEVGGGSVALKFFELEDVARVRREAITLRHLRVPGVVSLLDDGVDAGLAYIVMEKIDGRPFPGQRAGPVEWSTLEGLACALLDTLGRVHRHGVVHGDLKPRNVLVSEAGRVTVLDVGIACGPSIDFAERQESNFEGTPCYMAPERIGGSPPTVAADLYAVGAMLFEAACGVLPHESDTVEQLFARRRVESAPAVSSLAPDLPPDAAALIDSLLERDPAKRPISACAAAERVSPRRGPRPGEPGHAFLGTRERVEELVRATESGRSLVIAGPHRSGKTRTLQEVAAILRGRGTRVVELARSSVPFGSLAPLPGAAIEWGAGDVATAIRAVEERLTVTLASGAVLIADDIDDGIDRWTTAALAACSAGGSILSSSTRGMDGARGLPPLRPQDLESLFAGRNRVFHLPEDAARLLAERTAGLAGRAFDELASWVRAGLVSWEGERIRTSRDALERLAEEVTLSVTARADRATAQGEASSSTILAAIEARAGRATVPFLARLLDAPPALVEALVDDAVDCGRVARSQEGALRSTGRRPQLARWAVAARRDVHARIAGSLAEEDESRLPHVVACDLDALPSAVASAIPQLLVQGRVDRALFWADAAFRSVSRATDPMAVDGLAASALGAALAAGSRSALERVLRLCELSTSSSETLPLVARLARAAVDALDSNPASAVAAVAAIAPSLSGRLRAHAESVRVVAGRYESLEAEEAAVRAACEWARVHPADAIPGAADGWLGWLRYRQGRFSDAAALHRHAADGLPLGSAPRALKLIAAAQALLEVGDLETAGHLAGEALAISRVTRNAQLEARASVLEDTVAYRACQRLDIDRELADATLEIGVPHLAGQVLMTQAAKAWRLGDLATAGELAAGSAAQFSRSRTLEAVALANALVSFVENRGTSSPPSDGGDAPNGSPLPEDAIRREVAAIRQPGVALQVLGLRAALTTSAVRTSLSVLAHSLVRQVPAEIRRIRKEVMSADEAVALIELVHGRGAAQWREPAPVDPSFLSPNSGGSA